MASTSEIQSFYKNQTIFLTGGTGFIGKVLIEKLLRLCYDLNKIYIVIREKKGKTSQERLRDIFDTPCFDNIKSTKPNFFEKIELIDGDCGKPYFGISQEKQEVLKREVNIIIHAAADVRFDQGLRSAAYSNIKIVQDIIKLAKAMQNLKVFLHVSTAYSNCPQIDIKEQFYEPGLKAEKLFALLDAVDDETLAAITPHLIKDWPNTYVFSKSIAEDVIKTEAEQLPIAIVRPGIIISSDEEPVPGWIDNFYGLIGLTAGVLLGAIKSIYCKRDNTLHCVPCDYIVNTIMAVIWEVYEQNKNAANTKESADIPIYNYVGSNKRPLKLRDLEEFMDDFGRKYPLNSMFWYPSFTFAENPILHKIRIFLLHVVKSYVIDAVLVVLGKRRLAVRKYEQINKLLYHTSYFTSTAFNFHYENVERLWQRMNDVDRSLFKFNMDSFNWRTFIIKILLHGRIYLLHERIEDIPKAKKKLILFTFIHHAIVALFWYSIFRLILSFFI